VCGAPRASYNAAKEGRIATVLSRPGIAKGAAAAIGGTPLIELEKPSARTGCRILGKAEFLNPGGSVKDRIALAMVRDAVETARLQPGGTIVEASAGNTGIGLAMVGGALGYKIVITIPTTVAREKITFLRVLGAEVVETPDVGFKDERHFYHAARRIAAEREAFHVDQFNNPANRLAHYRTTGPEIWEQTGGRIDVLVTSAGTGGTISGTALFLKEQNPDIRVFLADPVGSALYSYVKCGVLEAADHDYIAEGIGIGRLVANFDGAPVDDAIRVTDQAVVDTAYRLLREEGLLLGMSTALNVWAAEQVALQLGPGKTIVTFLSDGGDRYMSRLYNPDWLAQKGFDLPEK
jgi:cysteine synthase A